mmetsp:Transcript_19131/g.27004  ORF Transcript_19131/g.27004 Transcript_19131/m.27004 type:complete len:137 (+) Transcript_19131:70-480(+)
MPPRAKAPVDPERQLMIKTKACQRLVKEALYYEKEVETNQAKLNKMKEDTSKDQYDIKKFDEVLQESIMMIPDSKARLLKSVEELSLFMDTHSSELNADGEFYNTAQSVIQDHLPQSSTGDDAITNVDDLKEGEAF